MGRRIVVTFLSLVVLCAQVEAGDPAKYEDRDAAYWAKVLSGTGPQKIRLSALIALQKIGKHDLKVTIPAIIKAMSDKDDVVAGRAVYHIGKIGESRKSIPALMKVLRDKDRRMDHSLAVQSLGYIGAASLKSLEKLSKSDDSEMRSRVAKALSRIRTKKSAKLLASLTKDSTLSVSRQAYSSLGDLGPAAASQYKYLLKVAKTRGSGDQDKALNVIAKAKISFDLVSKDIVKLLDDPNVRVQESACRALGSYGETALPIADKILNRLTIKSNAPAKALEKIGEKVIPLLIANMDNKDPVARLRTLVILGNFKEKAKPAIPAIEKALKDEDPRVFRMAKQVLKRVKR